MAPEAAQSSRTEVRGDRIHTSLGAPTNLAAWSTASLSQARYLPNGGIGAGTHAFFAGGMTSPGVMSSVIDIYDAQSGLWSTETLSSPRSLLSPLAVDQRVLFAGGTVSGVGPSATVDVYDEQNSVWLPPMALSAARADMGATAVGSTLYFAGGYEVGGASARVDVYDGLLVSTPFCFGDGSATACPCGNGTAGNGCPNSVNANGANLSAGGLASIATDLLVLRGSEMPNSSALYFQGTAQIGAGAGLVLGDGLRCAGGSVIRLGTKVNSAGASGFPQAGDPPISVRGLVTSPGIRTYQVWYRNAASFCTTATFNLTNGLSVTWTW